MSTLSDSQFPERMTFFDGQRLFADDMNSIETFNREMRWLHNFSLHQPGIGKGFSVVGEKGASEITIGPGYAIDAQGREIVLNQEFEMQVPPVADDGFGEAQSYDLMVQYPDDVELEEVETQEGVCSGRGVIRLSEEPNFCWVEVNTEGEPVKASLKTLAEKGLLIRLARISILNCRLESPVSVTERRNARPAQQAFVVSGATGTTNDDATEWSNWVTNRTVIGAEVRVDTSKAGFVTTPSYQAHIMGERVFERDSNRYGRALVLDGPVHLTDVSATEFTLRVYLPAVLDEDFQELISAAREASEELLPRLLKDNKWHVVWMGVEG